MARDLAAIDCSPTFSGSNSGFLVNVAIFFKTFADI